MNAHTIPQETLDTIVDFLCTDKKADAILLYHQVGQVDLLQAWAAIQNILVDLGEESTALPQQASEDSAYLEAQYYANWCLPESAFEIVSENAPETILGQCTFEQLPQRYQALFQLGPNRISSSNSKRIQFFPETDIVCKVLMALPFLFMWTTIPFLGVFHGFPLMWAWHTWPKILFFLQILIVSIPPLVMGIYTVRLIQRVFEFVQQKKAGTHGYGLLIDEQNVVGRQFAVFKQKKNCLFLPRHRILNVANRWGGRNGVSKFFIQYINDQDQRQWLTLERGSSCFGQKPHQLSYIFENLLEHRRGNND